jgi:ligand-binding SRPBCC domain-containing protein
MTRTWGTVSISRPVAQVFDYVTSAGNWPQWYPITRSVTGVVDRPGQAGDRCVEKVSILGVPFTFYWTTVVNDYPRRYVFEGRSNVGGKAVITYAFTPEEGATLFTRELVYEQTNPIMKALDEILIARLVGRVSAEAVQNLKVAIEST